MSTTSITGKELTQATGPSSSRSPWEYAAAFAVYATVMISWADASDSDLPAALAWLVFVGAVTVWWNPLSQHLSALTGTQLGSVPSTGKPTL